MTTNGVNQPTNINYAIQIAQEAPPVLKQEATELAVSVSAVQKAQENVLAPLDLLLSTLASLGANLNVQG